MPSPLRGMLLAALAMGQFGCSRGRPPDALATPYVEAPPSEEAAYLAPPRALAAVEGRGGAIQVQGSGPPLSRVEIDSPEGQKLRVQADSRGRWTVRLPPSPSPRLYAVSATLGGRAVHAEGALVTAPGASAPLVVVRAGYAALPLGPKGRTGIDTADYDPAGFLAVAGGAPPHATLALSVDGAPAAVGQAGADGRYAILATGRRLTLGAHALQIRAPDRTADRRIVLDAPAPLGAPYQAWRTDGGWRVEWALNGGGVQTTLILSP